MMQEIKTMTIYFYNSFYNGYCLCHVPCVIFFLLFLFLLFLHERIFYLQETIYRIVNSKSCSELPLYARARVACLVLIDILSVNVRLNRQPNTCNLFCNIVAKRVE